MWGVRSHEICALQVHSVIGQQATLFQPRQCFLGQSGRGNNWAFGYSQLMPSSLAAAAPERSPLRMDTGPQWDQRVGALRKPLNP